MRARWQRARSWTPTFSQEVALTWATTLAAALLVGTTLGMALDKLVARH